MAWEPAGPQVDSRRKERALAQAVVCWWEREWLQGLCRGKASVAAGRAGQAGLLSPGSLAGGTLQQHHEPFAPF